MSQRSLTFFLVILFFTASCSQPRQATVAIPEPKRVEPLKEEIITLVLSVGGVRGLAHIGAIDAIKQKGIKVSSVFGNSMGAVIGGLYVTAPNSDLIKRYRDLISAFQKRIEQDTPLYRKIGIWLRLTEAEFDNKRFEIVMSDVFGRARIEDLPIKFATSYKVREGDTIRDVGRVSGDLAEAIARSANNPFIFKNAQLTYIDPGIDRMSAIPVEDAYRIFKPDRIIAVNVTGDQAFHSKNTICKLTEVKLNIPDFRPEEELSGTGRNFNWLYKVGYDGVMDALNRPASP